MPAVFSSPIPDAPGDIGSSERPDFDVPVDRHQFLNDIAFRLGAWQITGRVDDQQNVQFRIEPPIFEPLGDGQILCGILPGDTGG